MKKQKFLWLSLILALIMSVSVITAFAAGEPALTVKTTSLELENAVYMNFKVQSQNISDTSGVKLLVWESYPGEYVKGTEDAELSVMRTEAGTGYLVFQYTDLAAKDMTKFVYVCAYAKVNGEDVYSKPTKFSIVQYAYNSQSNAKLKPLVDNMLAYGASAQTYFNYKTDFLATDPIVKVRVEGGTHADGFKTMYYQKGSMATFIAAAPAEGTVFSHWENSKGISVGTSSTLSIPVNADDTYTAIYRDASAPYTEELIFVLSEDKTYYIVSGLAEKCADTHIVIPAIYNGLPVKEIGDLAFNSRFEITAVTIPDSVTYIGNGAFKFCERLEKINMSANIEYVGYEAFHATAYYNDAENRENGALYIGNCLYEIDESTETYTVKDGTTILAYYAFGKTSELKEIYLPNSLTAITPFHFSVTYNLLAIHVNDDHPTFMVKNGDLYSKDGTVLLQYAIGKTDESFVVPSHVTVIEESAFEDADSLKSVTISEGVTKIGMYAFYGCNYLESIVLPDTLADIDNGAFAFCERLESIELPDGLQRIGANAFSGCLSLKCMDIPESVTEIGETAFADCHGLTSVTIPEGHKYIGYGWFGACSSLKTVVIPNGVERIDPLAFAFCENLEYIVLPKTLTYIAEEAFKESNNLKYVCYEGALNDFDFVIEEGNESFFNAPYHCYYGETCPLDEFNFWWHYNKNGEIEVWSHLQYSLSEDETYYSVIGKNNSYNETEIVIPPMYKGLPVKSIKYFSFEDDTTITSVVIPDSVTGIERFAFSGCTALEEIVMSENVTFVGSSAFHGTAYYNNAENWENGALYIGHCLYAVDDEVEVLGVKQGTTLMADNALFTDNLKEVSLPNSLEALSGDYYGEGLTAIYVKASHPTAMSEDGILYSKDGTQLICYPAGRSEESFAVPNGVTQICDYAFHYSNALKFVTLPESLTNIGMEAFFGCENLVSINLPDALKTIGEAAFYGCVSLESVEFPEGLQSIGAEAFEGCMSLKTLILPDASTEIGEMAFAYCRGLESIEIPEGFTHIGGAWFGACSSLKTVVIPNGVERIDEAAFASCENLEYIVLPKTLTYIAEEAFSDSNNLQNVYFHGTEEEWNKITVCADNDPLIEATVYYYSATRPATEGNFWFYDENGEIVVWAMAEEIVNGVILAPSTDGLYYIVCGLVENNTETKIIIPDTHNGKYIKEIAPSAFYGEDLVSITLPNSLVSIGEFAFAECETLASVFFGGDKVTWKVGSGNEYFINADLYYYSEMQTDEIGNFWYYDENGDVVIQKAPESTEVLIFTLSTDGTYYIVTGLQENCTDAEIVIPSKYEGLPVKVIGEKAFYNHRSQLTDVFMPASVTEIGAYAFDYCSKLTSVNLSPYLTSLGSCAFRGCSDMTEIEIPAGVTVIKGLTFSGCRNLVSVSLPSTLTEINAYAFEKCWDLTDIVLPETLMVLGRNAFSDCTSLTSISLPSTLTEIGESAFKGCQSLTALHIPEGVTSIGASVVAFCNRLESLTVSAENTVYHGEGNCIILTENMTLIAGCATSEIPDDVKTIGEYAFHGAVALKEIELPISVTKIEAYAFLSCENLIGINIPETVTEICGHVFDECYRLTIHYPGTQTEWNAISFDEYWNYDAAYTVLHYEPYGNGYKVNKIGECVNPDVIIADKLWGTSVTDIGASAFANTTYLMSVTIPEGVSIIQGYAFLDCVNLENVEMPSTVTDIAIQAFYRCRKLESIEFSPVLTSIGGQAFYNCDALKSVSIPSSVTSIEAYAFSTCDGLIDVVIAEGVESIGIGAFYNCATLKNITLPKSIINIGKDAFGYYVIATGKDKTVRYGGILSDWLKLDFSQAGSNPCTGGAKLYFDGELVTDIKIPASMIILKANAFRDCTSLESVSFARNVRTIDGEAFSGCSGLERVDFSSTITSIGKYAFFGCSSLTSITLPGGVTTIETGTFRDCSSLSSVTLQSGLTAIGERAFSGCANLVDIKIPDSVTSIGDIAFSDCASLVSIEIPNGVTSIGSSAFSDCTSLVSIEIPNGVTSIGSYAFDGCTSLASIELPDSVTSIGSYAFYNCTSLTSIEIPDSVTTIGNDAFYNCTSLESIELPNSVTSIGDLAFYNCTSLTAVYFTCGEADVPDITVGVGNDAFLNAHYYYYSESKPSTPGDFWYYDENGELVTTNLGSKGLSYVLSTDGTYFTVRGIGTCTDADLVIPDRHNGKPVTAIGNYAFNGCTSLASIELPNSVTSIGDWAFDNCTSLASIELPNSVTSIGDWTFSSCTSLTSIEIPDSVTTIGNDAFYNCTSLASIKLPNSVTSIGDRAFYDSTSLTAVYFTCGEADVPDITVGVGNDPFLNATRYYYTETQPTTEGNFWCYDSKGGIAIWKPVEVDSANELIFTLSNDKTYYIVSGLKEDSVVTEIVIPAMYQGKPVKEICRFAFKDNTVITSVVIPENVRSIGEAAFSGCSSIESMTIPFSGSSHPFGYIFGTFSYIGGTATYQYYNTQGSSYSTFYIPTSLKTVILIGVTSVGNNAFSNCINLKTIVIPDGVTNIGDSAFCGCTKLTNFEFPDSVTTIGNNAFRGCTNLTSVVIPAKVVRIGAYVFCDCTLLHSIRFVSPTGWYLTTKLNYVDGSQVSLPSASDNATYFKSTYKNYFWYKT